MCILQTGACSASHWAGPTSFQFSVLKRQKIMTYMCAAGFEPAKLWFHRIRNNHPTHFTSVKSLIFLHFCCFVFLLFSFFGFFPVIIFFLFPFYFLKLCEKYSPDLYERFLSIRWTFFKIIEIIFKFDELFSNSMNFYRNQWTLFKIR